MQNQDNRYLESGPHLIAHIAATSSKGRDLSEIVQKVCAITAEFIGADQALAVTVEDDETLVSAILGGVPVTVDAATGLGDFKFVEWYARAISEHNLKPVVSTVETLIPLNRLARINGLSLERSCIVLTLGRYHGFSGAILISHEEGLPTGKSSEFLQVMEAIQAVLTGAARRIAVERQQQHDSFFRTLAEQATDMIIWTEPDGTITFVSRSCERVAGYHPVEMVGFSIYDFVHHEDGDKLQRHFEAVMSGPMTGKLEYRFRRKDGSFLWVETTARVVAQSGTTKEDLVVSAARVLTRRKQTEEMLEASESRHRALTEVAVEAIISIDSASRIVSWNPGASRIFGYSEQEAVGQSLAMLMPEKYRDKHMDGLKRFLRTGEKRLIDSTLEIEAVRKSGETFPIELSISTWDSGSETFFGGIIRDISQRRSVSKAMVEQSRRLRDLAARLQQIREDERTKLSREVHDRLGQALTGLRMDIALIESSTDLDEPVQKRLDAMKESIDETVQTVRRIAADLRPGVLDDLGIEAAIEWETKEFAKRLGVASNFKSDIEEPIQMAKSKATAVFRVLQELVTNIGRHAKASTVTVSLSVANGNLRLTVEDDGVGFDTSIMKGHKSLGLLGIEERLSIHKGKFEVYSEPGKGTRSVVTVPFDESN